MIDTVFLKRLQVSFSAPIIDRGFYIACQLHNIVSRKNIRVLNAEVTVNTEAVTEPSADTQAVTLTAETAEKEMPAQPAKPTTTAIFYNDDGSYYQGGLQRVSPRRVAN